MAVWAVSYRFEVAYIVGGLGGGIWRSHNHTENGKAVKSYRFGKSNELDNVYSPLIPLNVGQIRLRPTKPLRDRSLREPGVLARGNYELSELGIPRRVQVASQSSVSAQKSATLE